MSKALLIAAVSSLFLVGCDSSDNHPDRDNNRQSSYQPSDGRNLGPGLQDASHGDPQFPADADKGGGGGMR